MFRIKSIRNYYPHLTTIAVLLGIIAIAILGTSFDMNPRNQVKVKSATTEQWAEQGVISGVEVFYPTDLKENVYNDQLHAVYDNGQLHVYMNDPEQSDYSIKLEDDLIVIYDHDRVVGTLTYKTSLGRMMIKDNE
jgi:hypothetical protein